MKLKGSKSRGAAPRVVVEWTDEAKVRVYAMVKVDKVKAAKAFAIVGEENGWELGKSYSDWPHTHIDRFKKEFERRCLLGDDADERKAKGATVDKSLWALLVKYDLIEDDPEVDGDVQEESDDSDDSES